jgi:hypothetical protein
VSSRYPQTDHPRCSSVKVVDLCTNARVIQVVNGDLEGNIEDIILQHNVQVAFIDWGMVLLILPFYMRDSMEWGVIDVVSFTICSKDTGVIIDETIFDILQEVWLSLMFNNNGWVITGELGSFYKVPSWMFIGWGVCGFEDFSSYGSREGSDLVGD